MSNQSDVLDQVRALLREDKRKEAQALLKPILTNADADTWVLAAYACTSDAKAIACLRNALELQPQHMEANRLLFKLEGARPKDTAEVEMLRDQTRQAVDAQIQEERGQFKKVRREKKANPWRWVGCLGSLLLMTSCTLFTLNMIGVVNGVISAATILTGGPTPVHTWNGRPISEIANAPDVIPPAQSQFMEEGRTADVLDDGYSHEYTFEAFAGQEIAIYVQFLSLGANRVSRNVVVLDPNGTRIQDSCQRDRILQGDNNIVYTCAIRQSGTYQVRILGRAGESVGAYFFGVETMQSRF